MRSITRQAGDPQDREARRVEDVVDVSAIAAKGEQEQRPVEPAEPGDQLHNPGSQKNLMASMRADKAAQEAEAAAREAERKVEDVERDPPPLDQPTNIGLEAAINIGAETMVQRFDTNGDDHLDRLERNQALEAVQSEESSVPGAGRMYLRQAEVDQASGDGSGEAFLAEQDARRADSQAAAQAEARQVASGGEGEAYRSEEDARKADAARLRAEVQEKAESSRAERLAALNEQASVVASPTPVTSRPAADTAYHKSDELGQRQSALPDVEA